MLKKEDIITIINELEIPKGEYWITSGAALVLHGVKMETKDVDLGCTTKIAQYFLNKGCNYTKDAIIAVNEDIELIENWYVDEIVFVDGLPVASLESIKKQKLELGREKDMLDIKLIDEFISTKI